MNVLILGHSATRSFGLPPESHLVSCLQQGLQRRFPDDTVEVFLRGWGFFSAQRLEMLLAEVAARQPDYLILDPAATWVTLPLLETPVRRWLPPPVRPLLGKALRLKTRVHGRVIDTAYGGTSIALEDALGRLVKRVIPPAPLYSASDVIEFFERLVCGIADRQAMEIFVLSPFPYGPDLRWSRRIPDFRGIIDRYQGGLVDFCLRQGLTYVDLGLALGLVRSHHDLLPDEMHLTAAATARMAEAVCDVLAERQRRRATVER
jgi:hypothetical protein